VSIDLRLREECKGVAKSEKYWLKESRVFRSWKFAEGFWGLGKTDSCHRSLNHSSSAENGLKQRNSITYKFVNLKE
jgi:hypothetical protein